LSFHDTTLLYYFVVETFVYGWFIFMHKTHTSTHTIFFFILKRSTRLLKKTDFDI